MNVGKAELANIGPKETRKRLFMGVAMLAWASSWRSFSRMQV